MPQRILFFGAVDYIRDDCEIEAWVVSPGLDPAIVRIPGRAVLCRSPQREGPSSSAKDDACSAVIPICSFRAKEILARCLRQTAPAHRNLRSRQDRLALWLRRFSRNSERVDPGLQSSDRPSAESDTPDYFVERAFEPLEDPCNETCVKQHR